MNKQIIVSVKDNKSETYNTPFFSPNANIAKRDFASILKNKQSTIAMFPEDYTLVKLGEFDIETGEITSKIENLAFATEAITGE